MLLLCTALVHIRLAMQKHFLLLESEQYHWSRSALLKDILAVVEGRMIKHLLTILKLMSAL